MNTSKKTRLLLLVLINGTMFLFGFLENIKGVSFPLIKSEFGVSYDEQGRMVSLLSFSYTLSCLAAGIILSRFGIRKVYLLAFILGLSGLSLVFFMPNFALAAFALFLLFSCFGLFEIGVNALASVLFTQKAALYMNLLHFLYGIGAIFGPKAAGILCSIEGISWRHVYLFSVPLAAVLFIPALAAKFPSSSTESETRPGENRLNFKDAVRSPMVWLFGITLGLMIGIEMATANWGALYFQDVYGLDPVSAGASFVSSFFILFTLSRLFSGFAIEKIGYLKSLAGAVFIIIAVFITGFALGPRGIFVLPVLGFFIAILWPTTMAVAIRFFGLNAPVMTSAVIAIGGLVNALLQLGTGYVNRYLNAAWGYRSCPLIAAAIIILLLVLRSRLREKAEGTGGR